MPTVHVKYQKASTGAVPTQPQPQPRQAYPVPAQAKPLSCFGQTMLTILVFIATWWLVAGR